MRLRRLQFSMAALLGVVTVSALPAHWVGVKRRYAEAEGLLDATLSKYTAGETTAEDVYRASVDCLRAQLRVPFSDHKAAHLRHLELMRNIEVRERIPLCGTMSEDALKALAEKMGKRADEIHVFVEEAQRWLDEAS